MGRSGVRPRRMRTSSPDRLAQPLYCRANMKLVHHFASVAALTAVTLAASGARAEDAPLFGFSLDAYAAPTLDRSVTNEQTGQTQAPTRSMVGLATVLNLDGFAFGGVVDGMPSIFGNGRLSTGALIGWQPRFGSHHYQLLGEVGQERFSDVGGSLLTTRSTNETWLGYFGARVGLTETFGSDGPFELGAWLFVRKDVDDETVSNTSGSILGTDQTTTQYRLGGYSGGVALRIGLRFDQKRPPAGSAVEVQYEPNT